MNKSMKILQIKSSHKAERHPEPISNPNRNGITTSQFPRITIVTPSYNQGRFLEKTIRSILEQNYPNLEYFIFDGGSTDSSIETIQKYEPYLQYWVSRPDGGQSHAINQGLAIATGVLFTWINSDDQLTSGSLWEVARIWQATKSDIICGACRTIVSGTGVETILHPLPPTSGISYLTGRQVILQPSTFFNREFLGHELRVREDLYCLMDWELTLRLVLRKRKLLRFSVTDRILSEALLHSESKSQKSSRKFAEESITVLCNFLKEFPLMQRPMVLWRINQTKTQLLVEDAMRNASYRRLLFLSLRQPGVLLSRFYWGAIRRILFRGR